MQGCAQDVAERQSTVADHGERTEEDGRDGPPSRATEVEICGRYGYNTVMEDAQSVMFKLVKGSMQGLHPPFYYYWVI